MYTLQRWIDEFIDDLLDDADGGEYRRLMQRIDVLTRASSAKVTAY